jgi:hypothetical protein
LGYRVRRESNLGGFFLLLPQIDLVQFYPNVHNSGSSFFPQIKKIVAPVLDQVMLSEVATCYPSLEVTLVIVPILTIGMGSCHNSFGFEGSCHMIIFSPHDHCIWFFIVVPSLKWVCFIAFG